MPSRLHSHLSRHRQQLALDVARRLSAADAPHYQQLAPGQLPARANQLVETLLLSVAGAPITFVDYIACRAEDRIGEGFFLDEIQLALSSLEERVWKIVVAELPPAEHALHLGRVTSIIGAAKDALARVYLRHKQRADARVARLEGQLEALSRGTDPAPLVEVEEEAQA